MFSFIKDYIKEGETNGESAEAIPPIEDSSKLTAEEVIHFANAVEKMFVTDEIHLAEKDSAGKARKWARYSQFTFKIDW